MSLFSQREKVRLREIPASGMIHEFERISLTPALSRWERE
jgi:hypothetical protein